jgi:predicted GNAT family acetyltransferase
MIYLQVICYDTVLATLEAYKSATTIHVNSIFVNTQHRYKGIAKFMLSYIIEKYKTCTFVELDDCTGNMGHPQNIYSKMLFRYKNPGQPEMICRLSSLNRYLKRHKTQYQHKKKLRNIQVFCSEHS